MKYTTLTPALHAYMLDISLRENLTLHALREETAKLPLSVMQIAPEQAQFMQFLLRLTGSKKVLELGTFTGYSALAMALALPEDGSVITCDINTDWTDRALPFWEQSGVRSKIDLRIGPALTTLATLVEEGHAHTFDCIFIDADKTNYMPYYEYALQLIKARGFILIDNIFWDACVIDPHDHSAQTREVRKLNDFIKQDPRVHVSLLPIADGLFLIQNNEAST